MNPLNDLSPSFLGSYHLISRLGGGGASTVYLAARADGVPQRLAVKVFRPFADDPDQEKSLMRSLIHANIVRLIDQGISERNIHFLVMEFVDGPPIDQYCDSKRLSVAERLALLRKVMDGVIYAHRHLVLHSDLKPSNILVDSNGEPKILDFGSASSLAHRQTEGRLLTPAFASPEQRRQEPIGVGSDVYMLGILAALLLTGACPVPGRESDFLPATTTLRQAGADSLQQLSRDRSTTPASLIRQLSGEIDAILNKALAEAPHLRYLSVEAFSDDLQAYLDGRPTAARPLAPIERAIKWIARHRVMASALAGLSASLVISTVGIAVQTTRVEKQRRATQSRLAELVRLTYSLDGDLYSSLEALPHSEEAKETLLRGTTHSLDQLTSDGIEDPDLALRLVQEYEKLARFEMALPGTIHRGEALIDAEKGLTLFNKLPNSQRQRNSQVLAELQALRASLSHGQS